MPRYVMIESNSGYVWFDTADIGALDETPAEACKRMDEDLNAHDGHVYTTHGPGHRLSGDGYLVYEAAADFQWGDEPSSDTAIQAIEDDCNLVAVVTSESRENRDALIADMVEAALAEDARHDPDESDGFDAEGFGNFFPEYRLMAAEHGVEWDDSIWDEAFNAYIRERSTCPTS